MTSASNEVQAIDVANATSPGSLEHSVTVLAMPDATEARIALLEARERRGAGPPLHRHSREDELVFVLEGRVTFHLGDERIEGVTGSSVVLPRGTEHGYVIESETARLLVAVAPAQPGIEQCMAELSRCPSGSATELEPEAGQDIERIVTTAARFGVEITRPRPDTSASSIAE
jgi:quercetin dioxygenase-like cupin family protein